MIFNSKVKYLLFIFGLFLPTQFGKHFWPFWSYVLGLRIDYLSPIIYVTDIISLVLIVVWVLELRKGKKQKFYPLSFILYPIFILFLSIGIFLSKNPLAGWYGFIKLNEFVFLGFALRYFFKINFFKTWFLLGVTISLFYESILAIIQFLQQHSVGGFWYFLGERTFSPQTPGIANMSLGGELWLRPYGTFSHPNVLGAFLLLGLVWVFFNKNELLVLCMATIFNRENLKFKFSIWGLISFIIYIFYSLAILLTFSRSVIFLWLIITYILLFNILKKMQIKNINAKYFLWTFGIIVIAVFLILTPFRERFLYQFFSDESLAIRIELIKTSILMIKNHLLFGLGFDNFLSALPEFSYILFRTNYIQPVHNIFLLIATESGLTGLIFFLWFLFRTIRNLKFSTMVPMGIYNFKLISLVIFIFLGNIDHYFLTIQQGQLLTTIIFAMCWAEYNA